MTIWSAVNCLLKLSVITRYLLGQLFITTTISYNCENKFISFSVHKFAKSKTAKLILAKEQWYYNTKRTRQMWVSKFVWSPLILWGIRRFHLVFLSDDECDMLALWPLHHSLRKVNLYVYTVAQLFFIQIYERF